MEGHRQGLAAGDAGEDLREPPSRGVDLGGRQGNARVRVPHGALQGTQRVVAPGVDVPESQARPVADPGVLVSDGRGQRGHGRRPVQFSQCVEEVLVDRPRIE